MLETIVAQGPVADELDHGTKVDAAAWRGLKRERALGCIDQATEQTTRDEYAVAGISVALLRLLDQTLPDVLDRFLGRPDDAAATAGALGVFDIDPHDRLRLAFIGDLRGAEARAVGDMVKRHTQPMCRDGTKAHRAVEQIVDIRERHVSTGGGDRLFVLGARSRLSIPVAVVELVEAAPGVGHLAPDLRYLLPGLVARLIDAAGKQTVEDEQRHNEEERSPELEKEGREELVRPLQSPASGDETTTDQKGA